VLKNKILKAFRLYVLTGFLTFAGCSFMKSDKIKNSKPNVVFILADDLGYRELGCYGQEIIRTPNIDKLAKEGIKFLQHYSGAPVSAPSRCCLLTGLHTGHAYIRDNYEIGSWFDFTGQLPLPDLVYTMAEMFKDAGYVTGAIGKWGLGGPGSQGHPNNQGFDYFFGYLCQRHAHNYYTTYLWRNNEKVKLNNPDFKPYDKFPENKDPNDSTAYLKYKGSQYAQDLMVKEALDFIKKHKEEKFFLYLPFPVPHVALQVPDESVQFYKDIIPEGPPYDGSKGYIPSQFPRRTYAGMITRMDAQIGQIMALLKKLGLDENTLVVFASDNGTTYAGGVDYKYFKSVGELRGLKGSVYEGGIRVPMIARWPGKIKKSSVSSHISAFWDFFPTFADLTGMPVPDNCDGISLLPELTGNKTHQKKHKFLYWEHVRRMQALRMGQWKAVRLDPGQEIQLFNLKNDISEKNDVSGRYPKIIKKIENIFTSGRTKSEMFPLKGVDKE